jgi:hypothetical protein
MSDSLNSKTEPEVEARRVPYEPPKLTHVGNARDLLAGSTGSIADDPANDPTGLNPLQSS